MKEETVHGIANIRWIAGAGALLAMTFAACAGAAEPNTRDANRGRQITEKWCALCHAVAGVRKPTAPAFAQIVRRPGRDDVYLRNFIDGDHFPMTIYRLFGNEKEDVLEYFRALRTKRQRRASAPEL